MVLNGFLTHSDHFHFLCLHSQVVHGRVIVRLSLKGSTFPALDHCQLFPSKKMEGRKYLVHPGSICLLTAVFPSINGTKVRVNFMDTIGSLNQHDVISCQRHWLLEVGTRCRNIRNNPSKEIKRGVVLEVSMEKCCQLDV